MPFSPFGGPVAKPGAEALLLLPASMADTLSKSFPVSWSTSLIESVRRWAAVGSKTGCGRWKCQLLHVVHKIQGGIE